ncbi:hypothetical protein NDN01_10050 [Sphingomonas sp. QA11]|uniref:hypothetical protein n=1 Tax=Sphingomonas sp. QA11 TaxID=2950605 RepID=UPI0023493266|nr:hypothetical protein [Sphingomonas sp. QA11]WCM29196.1 hypothetical protein NDN01_10050 [Sphingomonas sp. QA11]
MSVRWSPADGHFYHADLHGEAIPADAVRVTRRRHAELLAGRAAGRAIVVGPNGRPELAPVRKPSVAQRRLWAVADIKAEARRRILTIASLERQANDNAAIATAAFQIATGTDGLGDAIAGAIEAARRRERIDTVRAASNALEQKIAAWSAAALSTFDAGADAHWPTGA